MQKFVGRLFLIQIIVNYVIDKNQKKYCELCTLGKKTH